MRLFYLFACVCLCAVNPGRSQVGQRAVVPQTPDSLETFLRTEPVDTTYALAMKDRAFLHILRSDYRQADSITAQLEKLRDKLDPVRLSYYVYFLKGTAAYHQGNRRASVDNYLKALATVENNPGRFKAQTWESMLNNTAAAYSKLRKSDSCIHYSLKAIKVQEQFHFQSESPYSSVGTAFRKLNKHAQAIPYYQKALAITVAEKNYKGMAVTESNLGTAFDEMGKTTEALKHYLSGLRHTRQVNYPLLETDFLVNLGLVYSKLKQYAKAEKYLKEGEKLSRNIGSEAALRTNLHNQGELYRELGKFALAEKCYTEALALAKKINDYEYLYTSTQALAEFYADTKQYQQAYDFLKAAGVVKDSIAKEMATQQTQEMIAKYEAEKKQQEIQLLHEQTQAQTLKIGIQQRNLGLVVAASLLSGIAGFAGYRRYRLKKLLEVEKVRTRIAADFHDEIGANLSGISLYSEVLLRQAQNHPELANGSTQMLENISRNSRSTISSINDLIWTVKPDNDLLNRTMVRMKEFAIPLLEAKNIDFCFGFPENMGQLELEMNMRKFLYLIFKEAINNALKYAGATRIEAVLTQHRQKISLRVSDNGKGFDPATVSRGNGLSNMEKRAAEVNGQLSVMSQAGQGTTVLFTFSIS